MNLYSCAALVEYRKVTQEKLTQTVPGYIIAENKQDARGRFWSYVDANYPGTIMSIKAMKIDPSIFTLVTNTDK